MKPFHRPESLYMRELAASQGISLIALALLHARQLLEEPCKPYVKAAEILTDWNPIATELMRWWSADEQREALEEATYLLRNFASAPLMPPVSGGRDIIHLHHGEKIIGGIFPKEWTDAEHQ